MDNCTDDSLGQRKVPLSGIFVSIVGLCCAMVFLIYMADNRESHLQSDSLGTLTNIRHPLSTEPVIEIANQSGVAGYNIGIYGTNFGPAPGSVRILGQESAIAEWSDTFVRVTVPDVPPGNGEIILTTASEDSASSPFQLYTIDPIFQTPPSTTFRNIAQGKQVYLTNLVDDFCFFQPSNNETPPTEFLTNFGCGFAGVTGDGGATFTVKHSDAILAIDLDEMITGRVYFQFFLASGWYPNLYGEPKGYVIETSMNSSDGADGNWQVVHTEAENSRASRLHDVQLPSTGAKWIRMRVTSTVRDDNTFFMKELRIFQPSNESQSNLDILALYGDSITDEAAKIIGHMGLADRLKELSEESQDLLVSVYGLTGQNGSGLINQEDVAFDIYDAFALDNMATLARYWGIALGTNDSLDSIDRSEEEWSNIGAYDERLEAIIQEIIDRERVPIIARIPDTDEAQGGFGTLETKRKILNDIDRLVAKYRLIPGPDLYTAFRYNIEFEESNWLRNGDGTHHSDEGRQQLLQLWAEAMAKGTDRAISSEPQATPSTTPIPNDDNPNDALAPYRIFLSLHL